jgi:hypothetical protein
LRESKWGRSDKRIRDKKRKEVSIREMPCKKSEIRKVDGNFKVESVKICI